MDRPKVRFLRILLPVTGLVVVAAALVVAWVVRHPLLVFEKTTRRALAKAGMTKTVLGAPGGRLVYFKGGSGPVVVLLHGANDQAGTWDKTVPGLLPRYTVLSPDLPGHGESEPISGPLPLATIVSGVRALLGAEAPEGAVVVGNSMGAWVAFLAAREGAPVTRIVAVNGAPLRAERTDLTLFPKSREEARRTIEALRDPTAPRIPGFLLDDLVRRAPSSPASRIPLDSMIPMLLDDRLAEVAVPVDVLWGASDRMLPLSMARRLASGLTRSRLTEIPVCGHVPQQECPRRFRGALVDLLERPAPEVTEATEATEAVTAAP